MAEGWALEGIFYDGSPYFALLNLTAHASSSDQKVVGEDLP